MSQKSPFELVAKTGFFVSLLSYMAFWGMDLLRPGFVSRTFSVHAFLASAIVFGAWWLFYRPEPRFKALFSALSSVLFGALLLVLVWGFGEGLGEHQVPVAILALFLPSLLFRLIRAD